MSADSADQPLVSQPPSAEVDTPDIDPYEQPRVFVKLFLHSLAMFTLPFLAYFFAKRVVIEDYDMTNEQGYIYGAIAAVIMVNVIIGSYVYQAVVEDKKSQPKSS